MPVSIRRAKNGKGWEIYEKSTGRVVAHSDTRKKAIGSMIHRNKAYKEKK